MTKRTAGAPLLIAVMALTFAGGFSNAQPTMAASKNASVESSFRSYFDWGSWWGNGNWFGNKPTIKSIDPKSGDIGTTITLTGKKFNDDSIVRFGDGVIADPEVGQNGKTLTFDVPESMGRYCPPNRACTQIAYEVEEGDYKIRVQNGTRLSNTVTFEVTGDGNPSDGPLEIKSITGPTALEAGAEGTWSIDLESDGEGNLEYAVKWGDEPAMKFSRASLNDGVQSTSVFTHTYATAGTYQPEFTVTDANGHAVTQKAERVTVSEDADDAIPHLNALSPKEALAGASITLTGTGFDESSTVYIGKASANNTNVKSDTEITFTIPTLAAGTYAVRVTDDDGTSNAIDLKVLAKKGKVSISSISAPTMLMAGDEGTWKVNVNSNLSGNLEYSVDWGETSANGRKGLNADLMTQSSSVFTHTYEAAGTYYPKFTVKDEQGNKASVSASVIIKADSE